MNLQLTTTTRAGIRSEARDAGQWHAQKLGDPAMRDPGTAAALCMARFKAAHIVWAGAAIRPLRALRANLRYPQSFFR